MHIVRTLALAAFAGAGAAAEAIHNVGIAQGGVIEMLPNVARDNTCTELPKFCTAPAFMYGYHTTVTYLCPETTATRERSTVHVTITKTTTVLPSSEVAVTDAPTAPTITPAPSTTEEPDVTTTIHSTLTEYKTITLTSGTHDASTIPGAISITGYFSATIPFELTSAAPIETDTDPIFTIQTSTNLPLTSTSGYAFPTMLPPVVNGTTTGVFYSASVANSTLVQPTAFYPNATSAGPHYAAPTATFVNRAPEEFTNAVGKFGASFVAFAIGLVAVLLAA